jgi:hypothetical protein
LLETAHVCEEGYQLELTEKERKTMEAQDYGVVSLKQSGQKVYLGG